MTTEERLAFIRARWEVLNDSGPDQLQIPPSVGQYCAERRHASRHYKRRAQPPIPKARTMAKWRSSVYGVALYEEDRRQKWVKKKVPKSMDKCVPRIKRKERVSPYIKIAQQLDRRRLAEERRRKRKG